MVSRTVRPLVGNIIAPPDYVYRSPKVSTHKFETETYIQHGPGMFLSLQLRTTDVSSRVPLATGLEAAEESILTIQQLPIILGRSLAVRASQTGTVRYEKVSRGNPVSGSVMCTRHVHSVLRYTHIHVCTASYRYSIQKPTHCHALYVEQSTYTHTIKPNQTRPTPQPVRVKLLRVRNGGRVKKATGGVDWVALH